MTRQEQMNRDAAGPSDDGQCPRGQLPHYAMARLQGRPDPREWADLQRHLEGCADCRAELDELIALLVATGEVLAAPDSEPPPFDLSLLPPWLAPARPAGEPLLLRRALDLGRTAVLEFGAALAAAVPQPSVAGAFRANGSGGEYHQQIGIDESGELDVGIDLLLTDPLHELYRLRVTVIEASDPFAQGGHAITLQYEAHSREATTDERGSVVFADVPFRALGQIQLTLRLRPSDD